MIAQKGSSELVELLHRKADVMGIPISGTFELTPMCSMDCRMCYVRMSEEDVKKSGKRLRTMDEWLAIAEELKEKGMLLLLLTGGEPFTYPGFRELYMKLREMGFVISINSNATLIDDETVAWLKENPPQRINITLYGASDETYLRLCRHPRGHTVVTRAIEALQDAGINVKLNCSVTPENVDDLEEIIRYSDERKLILQATSYMFPPVRRDKTSVGKNNRFEPADCARVEARIRLLQRGRENLLRYCENVEQHCPLEDDATFDCEGDAVRCRAGKSSLWLTWDGRMLMCGMLDQPGFDLDEVPLAEAWEKLRASAREIRLPRECAACDARDSCRTCAAMIYTETGSYEKKPQYRCDLMRATPAACRSILKEENENE